MLRLTPEIAGQTEHKETEKAGLPKFFLFLPNFPTKIILLWMYLLVKSVAKTLGMSAHIHGHKRSKQKKGRYLKTVTISLQKQTGLYFLGKRDACQGKSRPCLLRCV